MDGQATPCVDRYLELSGKKEEGLNKILTPNLFSFVSPLSLDVWI